MLLHAKLDYADLSYANLSDASLMSTTLYNTILNRTIWTDGTTCESDSIDICYENGEPVSIYNSNWK